MPVGPHYADYFEAARGCPDSRGQRFWELITSGLPMVETLGPEHEVEQRFDEMLIPLNLQPII